MKPTLAFDIYGTLIDTNGVVQKLSEKIGEQSARSFSGLWRNKQLEYTFRRGLMGDFVDFSVCTRQALDWVCETTWHCFDPSERQALMDVYGTLPAFPDVQDCLEKLTERGIGIYAFSNGSAVAVENLLKNAGLRSFFNGVISVEEVRTFKPSPAVYRHFLEQTRTEGRFAWLVSSNPFDVLGALSAGMKSVWLRRTPENVMDPWDVQPTATLSSLDELRNTLPL